MLIKKGEYGEADRRLAYYLDYTAANVADAIKRIARGEIVAAIFKAAISKEVCREAARRIGDYSRKTYYEGAPGVGRIGPSSLYETQFGTPQHVDYYRGAAANLEISRSMFPAGKYPLDELRIWLDDTWPNKVGRLRLEDGLCSLGLIRFLETNSAILAHNDCAPSDARHSLVAQGVDTQIAYNALLQAAEAGGATRIYPKRMTRGEYDANRRPAPYEYALRAECLPPNPVIIRPEPGDVYLFDAGMPHEVEECTGARARNTLSAFIAVMRNGDLSLFS